MAQIEIPQGEQGQTRVFSLSVSDAQAEALARDTARQMTLLGVGALNADGIEVFALCDLGDLGLAGYLREGIDVDEQALNQDKVKLAALDGWVMLLHSRAFSGAALTLVPAPELTLIGSYAQTPIKPAQLDMGAKSAGPYTGTPDSPVVPAPSRRARGSVVIGALVLIALAILWAAL